MAVEHFVAFKFKDNVSPERRAEHMAGLRGLKEKVPGILSLSCGENFSQRAQGFHIGLIVTLEDRAALKVYADHPEHVAVGKPLIADCQDVLALDYERN